ncbi:MAG: hypothetical protein JSW56_07400 [Deltaproteobacteria bacterium]|nr:MAG: hypothetical protein JSW56_07400 [Deltaproteobacteria bacterium]
MNSKKVVLSRELLKLYYDGMSGEVVVTDKLRTIRIYLDEGNVVYAEGVDEGRKLVREIAEKKGLDPRHLEELEQISEKAPQYLGKTLLERRLISEPVWKKFLEIKVKYALAAAFGMDAADVIFREVDSSIPPNNLIDYNMIQLILDTIRLMEDLRTFERHIPGDEAVFTLSEGANEFQAIIPLNPFELTMFSLIDGQKTIGEIIESKGLAREDVYKTFYLLLCFDLITLISTQDREAESEVDYTKIINIYLDLLRILETNFRKEVGKRFESILHKCLNELTGQSKELLRSLDLSKDYQTGVVTQISKRFAEKEKATEGRLVLSSSFNKLVFLLIMRMQKLLGKGLVERSLKEMMSILQDVERYRREPEIMDYVRGNLRDYFQQISA